MADIGIEHEVAGATVRIKRPDGQWVSIEFPWPVAQTLVVKRTLLVRTEPPLNANHGDNVHGVDENGVVVWTVSKEHAFNEGGSTYTGMYERDGTARLYNWEGFDLIVDPPTGVVLGNEFVK